MTGTYLKTNSNVYVFFSYLSCFAYVISILHKIRKPRVSSLEMERKMNGRKLIKLFQLQNKIATEKLEDQDWVTFGVIVKKVTPQSSNNGKTFSIWRLNDLKNFDTYVSLFLFGDVHKEHWKTDQGVAIGILNANLMKPKDGSEE
ncbi:hypothetical protein AB205_0011820, partial [Aquarana catesbeiana]